MGFHVSFRKGGLRHGFRVCFGFAVNLQKPALLLALVCHKKGLDVDPKRCYG